LPVSAIARFEPVIVSNLQAQAVSRLLKSYPYQRFPVVQNGALAGVLTRKEAERAMAEKREPKLETAVTCLAGEKVGDLQGKVIESNSLMVVLVERPGGQVLGVVTLHDVLRAEAAMAEAGAG
jgi:CIC family chloride channel protein